MTASASGNAASAVGSDCASAAGANERIARAADNVNFKVVCLKLEPPFGEIRTVRARTRDQDHGAGLGLPGATAPGLVDGTIAKAACIVIVDHTDGLHKRITDCGSNKLKATFDQILAERITNLRTRNDRRSGLSP